MLQSSVDTTNFNGQKDLQSVPKKWWSFDSWKDAARDGIIDKPFDPIKDFPSLPLNDKLSFLTKLMSDDNLKDYKDLLVNDKEIEAH